MTAERWFWWAVLCWVMWRSWSSMRKAERAIPPDVSGTLTLQRGARSIEDMLRLAGNEDLTGEGAAVASWWTEVMIDGRKYRMTLERRVWESE